MPVPIFNYNKSSLQPFYTWCLLACVLFVSTTLFLTRLTTLIYFFWSFFSINGFNSANSTNSTNSTNQLVENYDVLTNNNVNFVMLLIAICVCFFLIIFLLVQANLLNVSFFPNSTFDAEKYSPYECGFTPFRTEWAQFDIKFYLVALLFLVFDVELMFLLPYSLSYNYLGFQGYIIFLLFFSILVIGFLVEWSVGMLVWKGEGDLAFNQLQYFEDEKKKIKQRNEYLRYMRLYLRALDQQNYLKIYEATSNLPANYMYWKFFRVVPVTDSFQKSENQMLNKQYEEDYCIGNVKNDLIYERFWIPYYGEETFSLTSELQAIERERKQQRIVRFFTRVYKDWFTKWYEKLDPAQRDFTLA